MLMILLLAAGRPRAGSVTGTVRAEGKPGTEPGAAGGKYESRKFKFVERINYDELQDFVVYIEGTVPGHTNAAPRPVQVLTQRDARFKPHVLPIMVGTTVEWPNDDEIYHNVFSFSEPKQFDLGLYRNEAGRDGHGSKRIVPKEVFDKPGRVDAFCSIHSAMHCIILVLPNPYFASTDSQGRYVIKDVPAGQYTLKAWHERLPPQTRPISVPAEGDLRIDFTLGITHLPPPQY